MIFTILVGLLSTFIDWLFTQWLNKHATKPSIQDVQDHKEKFLKKVAWRFWLGPNRVDRAGKLYDQVVMKYSQPVYTAYEPMTLKRVKEITSNLTSDLKEDA